MRALEDPVFRSMHEAPTDDEPTTAADRRGIKGAERSLARAGAVSSASVRAELAASTKRSSKKKAAKKKRR
ncbi:MAG: hypothetical protein IPG45_16270 [Deltaproteobacteria bacterium]|nr:hypothetical protein [Deltaproteobacteria bacterium]